MNGIEPQRPETTRRRMGGWLVAFAAASLLLAAVSLGTGWIPARKAGRIDPVEALRHD